jgi:hypothetical protein
MDGDSDVEDLGPSEVNTTKVTSPRALQAGIPEREGSRICSPLTFSSPLALPRVCLLCCSLLLPRSPSSPLVCVC